MTWPGTWAKKSRFHSRTLWSLSGVLKIINSPSLIKDPFLHQFVVHWQSGRLSYWCQSTLKAHREANYILPSFLILSLQKDRTVVNKLGKGRVRRPKSSLIFIFSHKYTEKVTRSWLLGNLCTLAVAGKLHLIIATFSSAPNEHV